MIWFGTFRTETQYREAFRNIDGNNKNIMTRMCFALLNFSVPRQKTRRSWWWNLGRSVPDCFNAIAIILKYFRYLFHPVHKIGILVRYVAWRIYSMIRKLPKPNHFGYSKRTSLNFLWPTISQIPLFWSSLRQNTRHFSLAKFGAQEIFPIAIVIGI